MTAFPFRTQSVIMSIEIKIRKNEPVDRAIRRLKKKLEREIAEAKEKQKLNADTLAVLDW